MTNEAFNLIEKLTITKPCWVNGVLKQPGDVVEISGNDKVELLGSKKAERTSADQKKEDKKK